MERAITIGIAVLAIIAAFGVGCGKTEEEKAIYKFAINPYAPRDVRETEWEPILSYLTEETGYQFEGVYTESPGELKKGTKAGEYDFVNAGSTFIANFMDTYTPQMMILTRKEGKTKTGYLKGVIFTRVEDGIPVIANLTEVSGEEIAIFNKISSGGFKSPMLKLKKEGVTDVKVIEHESMGEPLKRVYDGEYDVGFVVDIAWERRTDSVEDRDKLYRLAYGVELPNMTIASRNDLPPEVVKAVNEALLKLLRDSEAGIGMKKFNGFLEADIADYEALKGLKFE